MSRTKFIGKAFTHTTLYLSQQKLHRLLKRVRVDQGLDISAIAEGALCH